MRKILFGIPHMGSFPWQTVHRLLGMKVPEGCSVTYHMIGNSILHDARDAIVRKAIDDGAEFVVMLDSDMEPPFDMLQRFIYVMDSRPEIGILTGLATQRVPPFQPCFYTKVGYDEKRLKPVLESPLEFPDEGLLEIQGCGAACVCMRVSELQRVLEGRESLYFPLPNLGEDLTFCMVARTKRVGMAADLSLRVGHVTSVPVGIPEFRAYYEKWKQEGGNGSMFGGGQVCQS